MTCSLQFAVRIVNSKPKKYKYYDRVWNKVSTTGFLNAKRQPLRQHELILFLYKKQPVYNPIMEVRGKPRNKGNYDKPGGSDCYGDYHNVSSFNNVYYPTSILTISNAVQIHKIHPTQKPVELLENIIITYTNKGMTILDNCMGSGTTGVACANTNRKFIGIELDNTYFALAKDRIEKSYQQSIDSQGLKTE